MDPMGFKFLESMGKYYSIFFKATGLDGFKGFKLMEVYSNLFSRNSIFPMKKIIPKSLKVGH